MGKIHLGPRHPHQDRKVLCMGKTDRRSNVKNRKRKSLQQMTKQTKDNASETDVPAGQGFGYPPHVFTDPTYAATIPHMEEEGEVEQEHDFLGKYCKFCDQCSKTYCWCNSSDWEEGLLNMEDPSSNPSIEKTPSPTIRKPPVGWIKYRHRVIFEAEQARPTSPAEEHSTDSDVNK